MAKEIIEQLQKIIDAVPIEIRAAKKMAALSDRCSSHMCVETGGGNCHWEEDCETDPDTGEEIDCDYFCEVDPCGGRACPALCVCPANFDILCAEGLGDSCPCPPAGHSQAECNCKFEEWNLETVPPTPVYYACPDLQSIIEEQVNTIGKAFKKIDDFFSEKKHVPVGIWFCSCSEEGHVGMCTIKVGVAKIEVGSCKTEVGHINELLELSRSGDYLYLSFHLNVTPPILKKEWNHQPPGLKDCVVRPAGEAGAAHRGEELVRIPFRCKDLLPDLIGECYGITECLNKCTIGEENCLPKCPNPFDDRCPCPRFENFHCCE